MMKSSGRFVNALWLRTLDCSKIFYSYLRLPCVPNSLSDCRVRVCGNREKCLPVLLFFSIFLLQNLFSSKVCFLRNSENFLMYNLFELEISSYVRHLLFLIFK